MKKVIAVEEGLSQVRNALERGGYAVVKPGSPGRTDATVITGVGKCDGQAGHPGQIRGY